MKVVTKVEYKTKREDKMNTLTINEERERLKTKGERKPLAQFPMQETTFNAETTTTLITV